MKDNFHEKEVNTTINEFFEKKFPLEHKKFKAKNEFLDYYVDLEKQLSDELKALLDKIKPVPINKIKVANNTLIENLIISFELNSYSKDINKIIQNQYREISNQIVKDVKNAKNLEEFFTAYIAKKLKEYTDQFYGTLFDKFKREEFPDFLVAKYIQLIKNKFLTLLAEKNIEVSYFYFSDSIITFIDVYQDIFVNKKQFLFNAKNKNECLENYFKLILLSNNINLKNSQMKYLDHLIQDFEYFVRIFNLESTFVKKNLDFNYNMNKLLDKYMNDYINISEIDAENKKTIILEKIIGNNNDNINMIQILNIILSYCLILNYLLTKNKKTGEIEVSIFDNYTSFASMKVLLDNTLANFEMIVDVEEMNSFAESVLIKDILASKGYTENKEYNIEKIKEILINNKKNEKLRKLSQDFLKGLNTKKYNKLFEFILSINKKFNESNVRQINLSPLNPKLTSNHCYIFISGFLSETSDHYEEWENMALNISAHNTCYFYNWPGNSLPSAAGSTLLNLGLTVLDKMAYDKLKEKDQTCEDINGKKIENPLDNFDPAKSFIDSSHKAALSGQILAHILASKLFFKNQTVTLVGFSLGTHVTKHCIKKMYELHYKDHIPCNDIIKNVVLIAGATSILGKEEKFKNIFSKMINGKLINCFSKEDEVLKVLYTGGMQKKPIGNSELIIDGYDNLRNIDFTPLKLGHTDYRAKMDLVMNKVDLYI